MAMLIDEIALAQLGLQDNIPTGIVLMQTHFVCPDPLPDHLILRSLCQHSIFRDVTAVSVNVYVFLPTLVNGPLPTIANLLANFEIAIFRVVDVSITDITLLRIGVLHDNASAATATANSELTYGNLQTRMYYPIPPGVAGAPAPQFLVAKTALADRLRAQDPHLVVPQAAAPIQPAAPALPAPDLILQQLVAGQAGIAAASKLTVAKLADYDRIQSMAAYFPPGRFASTIALLKGGCICHIWGGSNLSRWDAQVPKSIQSYFSQVEILGGYQDPGPMISHPSTFQFFASIQGISS